MTQTTSNPAARAGANRAPKAFISANAVENIHSDSNPQDIRVRAGDLPSPDAQSRAFIHEMLGFVRIGAQSGQLAAEIGDDAGLEYQLRRIIAHMRQATGAFKELAAIENARRAEEGA